MGQTTQLLQALKTALKGKGVTYADIAVELGLSEASVKRLFSTESFSLKRLDQVCEFIGFEVSDLTNLMKQELTISRLTQEQEMELVSDRELVLVTELVINHWKFDEILSYFKFDEPELIQILVRLDKLSLVELLPGNKVKLLTTRNFTWIEGGPVQRFFQENIQSEFFKGSFNQKGEALTFVTGMLSDNSHAMFIKRLGKLVQDFDEMCHVDSSLPLEDRFGYNVVLAIRPWELSIFNKFRRI